MEIQLYKGVCQHDYKGANATLRNGNKVVPLEKRMPIDMLIIQLCRLNCGKYRDATMLLCGIM